MGGTTAEEQRKHTRVASEIPVSFTPEGQAGAIGKSVQALTTSISRGGLSFVTPLVMPVRTRLRLVVSLPGCPEDLDAEAVIVRIASEFYERQEIEYGVAFERVKPQEALDTYIKSIDIMPLLTDMLAQGASSLHLSAFAPPVFRMHGELTPARPAPLPPEKVEALIFAMLNSDHRAELDKEKELDFPFTVPGTGRWRVNVHLQRGYVEAAIHAVDTNVPGLTDLGLPGTVREMALSEGGLIVVTGPPGSGRSATLAAMISAINEEASKVIITLEDPIRYIHENSRSLIKQREIRLDTHSFAQGLAHALRQDPDVILVGSITNQATLDLALQAAESGCLVLARMHTPGVARVIRRMMGMYPREERDAALNAIGAGLRAIISQRLLPATNGGGHALAAEILSVNEGIRNAIRTGNLDKLGPLLPSAPGSLELDVSLRNLVLRGDVSFDVAAAIAHDPERLRKLVSH